MYQDTPGNGDPSRVIRHEQSDKSSVSDAGEEGSVRGITVELRTIGDAHTLVYAIILLGNSHFPGRLRRVE